MKYKKIKVQKSKEKNRMLTEFGYETYVFGFCFTDETPLYYQKKNIFQF
jgi:hypothetical protein